jgi:N-carbamoyl-L-amino-acid hydrolase
MQVDFQRLSSRIDELALIGATPRGGVSRLAFTEADTAGRDQVVAWMKNAGLGVQVDAIGNIFGSRPGLDPDASPIMTGSHIDTVGDGGKLDGNLGVLAGLEVVETLNDASVDTRRPICVAVFSNEEGVRFQPDMMGSLVHAGDYSLADALSATDRNGIRLGDALAETGYAGDLPVGSIRPHAFVELHIEQGPVLETEDITLGAVENLQGISWTEVTLTGQANHAGTTPMSMRCDAGFGAAKIIAGVREITARLGGAQVATCGQIALSPNLVNVVARQAVFTVDLRNPDDRVLQDAEALLDSLIEGVAETEGLKFETRKIARFESVSFDPELVSEIEHAAALRGHSCRRMTSGAGHDAQMMARICPAAMIFIPSIKGISHNPAEATQPHHIEAGANVLLDVLVGQADR